MNGYLLDTRVVLWWLAGSPHLSTEVRERIEDPRNRIFVSAAAAWEMAIKKSIGRLEIPSNLTDVLAASGVDVLDINMSHAFAVADLPAIHRDPFDRLQIAQAQMGDLVFITHDTRILEYDVHTLQA